MIPHIRTHNPQGYRPGQWAIIVGVEILEPMDHAPIPCFLVMFPDSKIDMWPIHGPASVHYEYMSVKIEPENKTIWGEQ